MLVTQMSVGESKLLIRTLDKIRRAGPPKSVASRMLGPPPETTHYNTKDIPNPMIEINMPDPAGNRTRIAGFEGRDSTENATATLSPKCY